MAPVVFGAIIFFYWAYTLDPRCENGGRCTGNVYDYKYSKYKNVRATINRLYCKKCGKIYKRSECN